MSNHPKRRGSDGPRQEMRHWWRLALSIAVGLAVVYAVLVFIGGRS